MEIMVATLTQIGRRSYQTESISLHFTGERRRKLEFCLREFYDAWRECDPHKQRQAFKLTYFEFNEKTAHFCNNLACKQWLDGEYKGLE